MLVDKKTGEIFLYGPIGADFFGDGLTAEVVIQALDMMGGKRVTARINSVGGSVFDGIAIYNALKRYSGGVDVVVDSLAASIASVIALAGETRTTASGGLWMIHRAMAFAFGNVEDVQKTLNMLEAGDKAIVDIYREATGKTSEELLSMMSAETWFSAEESLAIGFSTATSKEVADKPAVANWFRNAPQAVYKTTEQTKPKVFVHRQAAAILCR